MNKLPEQYSVQLVEEYYMNNYQLFFDCMDENIIWMGPANNQYIEGKQNLIRTYKQERNTLSHYITQMSSKCIHGGNSNTCEVLLKYIVCTYYPSGYVSRHNQRVTFFWKKVKRENEKVWRCSMMHISNGMDIDSRDNIFPIHLDEFELKRKNIIIRDITQVRQNHLIVKGEDYSTYYIDYNEIQFICGDKSKLCSIHTRYGVIRVRLLINQIEKMLPKQFYRPHRSYLVNVPEIINVVRYKITLRNKVEIPIPEKKYKTVADDINRIVMELQNDSK